MHDVFDIRSEKAKMEYMKQMMRFKKREYVPTLNDWRKLDKFMEKLYYNSAKVNSFMEQTMNPNVKYNLKELYDLLSLYYDLGNADIRKALYMLSLENNVEVRSPYIYLLKIEKGSEKNE